MGVVKVNNLIVYAYHGCLAEEAIIGSEYVINIKAWGKTKGSAKSDSLEDAIDYVLLSDVAVAQMKIRANLLENVVVMGNYLNKRLHELKDKHPMIGDVRGKGLFQGVELVKDRGTREPVHESIAIAVAGDCMANGVIIGRTNRSFTSHNNTLCLSPALIATQSELDEIVDAIDGAITRITA